MNYKTLVILDTTFWIRFIMQSITTQPIYSSNQLL